MTDAVIVLNAGSTSLKFGAYGVDGAKTLPLLCRGQIDCMQGDPHFVANGANGKPLHTHRWGAGRAIDHKTALQYVITWLESNAGGVTVAAAGHRVVLGGTRFAAPVPIEGDVLDYLESLAAMEPSHQAYNVLGARVIAEAFPRLPQVACFDSSFHRTMPSVAQTYALPQDARDAGARHWGYHGISYDYISRQLPKYAPDARRVIAAHLGGGASMCAMLDGKSVDTTMGFHALWRCTNRRAVLSLA
jgi:acetate kinase